jgi:hypothetical protein
MKLTQTVDNPFAMFPNIIVKLDFEDDCLPELLGDRPVRIQLFVEADAVREVENAIRRRAKPLRMERRVRNKVREDWYNRRISPDQIVLIGSNGDVKISTVFTDALRDELLNTVHEIVAGLGIAMENPSDGGRWSFTGESYVWKGD